MPGDAKLERIREIDRRVAEIDAILSSVRGMVVRDSEASPISEAKMWYLADRREERTLLLAERSKLIMMDRLAS